MRSTEEFDEISAYEILIQDLIKIFQSSAIESYEGFYDLQNIKNFFDRYDTLEDCYPSAPKKLLRSVLFKNPFKNWREEENQSPDTGYQLFQQSISDNTFCEIAERKNKAGNEKYALLNHHACTIPDLVVVTINKKSEIKIDNLINKGNVVVSRRYELKVVFTSKAGFAYLAFSPFQDSRFPSSPSIFGQSQQTSA